MLRSVRGNARYHFPMPLNAMVSLDFTFPRSLHAKRPFKSRRSAHVRVEIAI